MRKSVILILTASLFFGCIPKKSTVSVNFNKVKNAAQTSSIPSATVSSVQMINNQLVITGNGFSGVTNVKVAGTAFNESFSIESKTATKIIANSIRTFSFDISKIFNVIISDASASATFPIDFSLCNATLNGKGFNCAAPISDKDVLAYDAVSGTWKPRPASGLNYLGTFDASSNPGAGPAIQPAGAYYVISDDGTIAAVSFAAGDWLVSNGSAWQKIDNSTAVLSVFGRYGAIVPQSGDYDLNMLGDVSFPVAPVAGKVLKFDGTNWVAGDDLSGGGAGSVTTATIAAGAVTDAKIDTVSASKITGTINSAQIADGTIVNADINAAAAIDYSKLNIPNTTIPYAKLNIADGAIPAAKISGLPSATVVLATTITDGDTTHAPDGNVVFDTLATKLDKTGGTISTILNVPTPVLNTEATTKLYVDTADNLKANKSGDTFSGVLTLDNDLRVKGGANYVTVKGNAASAAYTLTLPVNAGTANQVLTTNGSGVLSWSATSSVVSSLNAANISGGTVSNAEFDWLDGVTSSIQAQLNAKEDSLATGGTTAQYFRGDKTLATLNTAAVPELTNLYFTQARAIAAPLTGVASTAGTITAADTILGAFGKMINTQGDYVSKSANSTVLSELTISGTGTIVVPTPTLLTHAANMGYVQTYVDAYGQWTKSGSDVYRAAGNVGVGTNAPVVPLTIQNSLLGSSISPSYTPTQVLISDAPSQTIGIQASSFTINLPSPASNSTAINIASRSETYVPATSALNYKSLYADNAHAKFAGSGSAVLVASYFGTAHNSGTGAVTNMYGVNTGVANGSTGTVDNAYGFYSNIANPGGGTITNAYGLYLDKSTVGTITNNYGIYQKDTANNYFGGNVGIGTTAPIAKLHVSETLLANIPMMERSDQTIEAIRWTQRLLSSKTTAMGDAFGSGLLLSVRDDDNVINDIAYVGGIRTGADNSGSLTLNTFNAGAFAEHLRVTPTGNVGIGTTIPAHPLSVHSATNYQAQLKQTGTGAGAYTVMRLENADTAAVGYIGVGGQAVTTTTMRDTAFFGTQSAHNAAIFTSDLPRMTVDSAGNVGIGITAPTQKLHVSGGNIEVISNTTMNGSGLSAGLRIYSSNSSNNDYLNIGWIAEDTFGIQSADTLTHKLLTLNPYGGNVGVGNLAPDEKFVVSNGTTTGKYTTGGWTHSSDARLKHNISPIEDALDKILKIRGVEYIFNSDPENKTQLGFIAQEVEPIFPEVVQTDKKGFKSMIYSNLIAPLVESVKALYARIQIQDRQIASKADKAVVDEKIRQLSNENEKLKKENSDIKAYLCSKDPKSAICH